MAFTFEPSTAPDFTVTDLDGNVFYDLGGAYGVNVFGYDFYKECMALGSERVEALAARMAGVPQNQLMMQKLMINQALYNQGLEGTQMLATVFDGITRHSPEGMAFKARAEEVGFKRAVQERDSGAALDEIWAIGRKHRR